MPREKVQYVLNQKYKSQEELEAPARKLVYDTLLPLHYKVTEMVAAWEKAQPTPIKDVAAFRLLSSITMLYWRRGTMELMACTLLPENTAMTARARATDTIPQITSGLKRILQPGPTGKAPFPA